ncbi:Asp/Glu/hydantoin racemase [Citricoccus sp. SGAir0253]|uniref:maleate cis-trans isomerase family protein n=1 Tax=Citricoccus sp. SGAir0253 TaxID=2567881 RepID=UPI0010CCD996|nr:Asp/Glu/hydantoin racemase [Citricoccus sp. SGAir0253]QCU78983.1 Asp/Glu/hydantoin racemase [Citricoccus sp. SGAir0253]
MPDTTGRIPKGPAPDRVIGVVDPYDMALDRELWRWMPAGVSLAMARTPYHPLVVDELMASALGDDAEIRSTARSLAAVEPEAVVFACASGSFVHGVDGARRISAAIAEEVGAPAVTTSEALLEALDALGLARVAIATPYVPRLTERLEAFLAAEGHSVVGTAGLGLDHLIWHVPYRVTAGLVREADRPEAEAVFVSCTNLPTFDIIAPLEAELGKPVLTANQVTAWAGLRRLGLGLTARDQVLGAAGWAADG